MDLTGVEQEWRRWVGVSGRTRSMTRKTAKGKGLLQLSCDGGQSNQLGARRTEESKKGGWSLVCVSVGLHVCLQEK